MAIAKFLPGFFEPVFTQSFGGYRDFLLHFWQLIDDKIFERYFVWNLVEVIHFDRVDALQRSVVHTAFDLLFKARIVLKEGQTGL